MCITIDRRNNIIENNSDKYYEYYGYIVTPDGDFYSRLGNKISWNKDGKKIKLNLDGSIKEYNGLKILYFLFNHLEEKPSSKYNVTLIDPAGKRNKENLALVERTYSQKPMFTDEEVLCIRKEYGIDLVGRNNPKRDTLKNDDNHPTISYRELAKKYKTSVYTIESIIQGTYGRKELRKRLNS